MRLFRRRKDAMEIWRAELDAAHEADGPRWTGEPAFQHAPDLDPSEVPPPVRMGFDGRPLPKAKGAITGLESGGISSAQHYHGA
jgi:hypothetical protein